MEGVSREATAGERGVLIFLFCPYQEIVVVMVASFVTGINERLELLLGI